MTMQSFEAKFEKCCEDGEVPGAIFVASDVEGKFHYEKTFGNKSLKPSSDPMPLDATFWMASLTKLPVSIAVMQCVERDVLKLDDDVTVILPELKGLPVLVGFNKENGKPILRENTKPITLKHLLTHTSGISYDIFHPMMFRYRQEIDKLTPKMFSDRTVMENATTPLLFEPGEQFNYGYSIDLAGKMLERATGISLEEYMRTHIWEPLGITNISFFSKKNPAIWEKMAGMTVSAGGFIQPVGPTEFRLAANPEGRVEATEDTFFNPEPADIYGGAGLFGNPLEYHKILMSLLKEDEKLIKKHTFDLMCQDHLTPQAKATMNAQNELQIMADSRAATPGGTETTHGIGGMIYPNGSSAGRSKGTLSWAGLPNLIWFIDREAKVAGVMAMQLYSIGDAKVNSLFREWEQAIYKELERN